MRIWPPPPEDRRFNASHSILIIVAAVMVAVVLGTLAVMLLHLGTAALTALTFVITAVCIAAALRLGKRSRRATLIFCTDRSRRLYFIDANNYTRFAHNLSGYESMQDTALATVRELCAPGGLLERRLAERGGLDGLAPEIVSVERLMPRRDGWSARCRVRYPNGGVAAARIPVLHGIPDEDELISEFERHLVSEL